MSLLMSDIGKKSQNRYTKAEASAALDALDKELPLNPGQLSSFGEEFEKIFHSEIQNKAFKAGQVVEGQILKITDDNVIVDINYKSEGIIPRSEFHQFNEENPLEIGQKVEVYIEQIEDKNGTVVLSKDKANLKKAWMDIIRAKENDEIIQGKVLAVVKGGLSVDIGIKAFLPGSQLDIRPVRKMDAFVGQTLDFKIIKMNHKRGNIILSRRAILEKEREKLPKLTEISKGSVVKGIVKNITNYGAFIDLGDKDGLLHITDMSWSRVEHPGDLLHIGQEIELKVLKVDTEKNRISLGLKQLDETKWEEAISQFEIGSIVKGKVSSIVDYGAFILLEGGLESLVHLNEISWNRKVKNPQNILKVGEEVSVKIIDIKKSSHKLNLSIKQTQPNPWLDIQQQIQIGDIKEFEVVSISDFGLFLKINDQIDGLVRLSDLSWTENIKPSEKYKVGDKVKAKVLDINVEEEKLSLGIKQLEENPWAKVEEKYPIGSRHEVEIVRILDFGVFVKVEKNIEGLIHISELSKKRVDKIENVVKLGDKVTAEILSIDKDAKKIALSIRVIESSSINSQDVKNSKDKSKANFMENLFAKALKQSINVQEKSKEPETNNEKKEDS